MYRIKLTAAILAIAQGILFLAAAVIATINMSRYGLPVSNGALHMYYVPYEWVFIALIALFIVGVGITHIVLGALFCRRKRHGRGIAITLLVFNCVFLMTHVSWFLSQTVLDDVFIWVSFASGVVLLVNVVLLSVYLHRTKIIS